MVKKENIINCNFRKPNLYNYKSKSLRKTPNNTFKPYANLGLCLISIC